jgi:hypothetical protein
MYLMDAKTVTSLIDLEGFAARFVAITQNGKFC